MKMKPLASLDYQQVVTDTICRSAASGIKWIAGVLLSSGQSKIELEEWDGAYGKLNELLYKLNPEIYTKHRVPTTNNSFYDLTDGTHYILPLKKQNFLCVEVFRSSRENMPSQIKTLRITFYGKNRYTYRQKFLTKSLKLTDKKHIRVNFLSEYNMSVDIMPHAFDNIVLDPSSKHNIMCGLQNWYLSKDWYDEHQLVHKIGVLLYGKPGTGKSTIVRAISQMFNNAPILVLNGDNVMGSIKDIFHMRKKVPGVIIVLIEDFDLFFKKRDEEEEYYEESGPTSTIQADKLKSENKKDSNQNAIFQLLDGVYSTDKTIYIATTNYKESIDPALIRHGRFDIQEELDYFHTKEEALKCVQILGYDEAVLDSLNITYPVQPAYLQSKIMYYRATQLQK